MAGLLEKLKKTQTEMDQFFTLNEKQSQKIVLSHLLNKVDNNKILQSIFQYKERFPISRISSIRNAWHGSYYFHNEAPEINELLLDLISNIVIENYTDPNLYDTFLLASWPIIYEKGAWTDPHNHGHSDIAGVYYVQAENTTPLIFTDLDFELKPKTGQCILFPSHLIHHVPILESNDQRIAISFNFKFNLKVDPHIHLPKGKTKNVLPPN